MKKPSLLEEARLIDEDHSQFLGKKKMSDGEILERLEVVLAYLKGEITISAASSVLKAKQGSIIAVATYVIRDALNRGLCKIEILDKEGR